MRARTVFLIVVAFFVGFGSSVGAAKISYVIWSSEISHAVHQCDVSKLMRGLQESVVSRDDRIALDKQSRILGLYCKRIRDKAAAVSLLSFLGPTDIELLYANLARGTLTDE